MSEKVKQKNEAVNQKLRNHRATILILRDLSLWLVLVILALGIGLFLCLNIPTHTDIVLVSVAAPTDDREYIAAGFEGLPLWRCPDWLSNRDCRDIGEVPYNVFMPVLSEAEGRYGNVFYEIQVGEITGWTPAGLSMKVPVSYLPPEKYRVITQRWEDGQWQTIEGHSVKFSSDDLK